MSPDRSLLLSTEGVSDSNIKPIVYSGFRFYEVFVTRVEFMKMVMTLSAKPISNDRRIQATYADVRFTLLDSFSYPVNDGNVSQQEIAASAMVQSGAVGYWDCSCGRRVPKDGLKCICGNSI